MRVVVTGGCGFIGSHLVERLVSYGHRAYVVDDLSTGLYRNVLSLVVQDLRAGAGEALRLVEQWGGADVLVHLAARSSVNDVERHPEAFLDNARMTQAAIDLAAGLRCSRFVFASTFAVHGDEAPALDPLSRYAKSKLASEYHVASACEAAGIGLVVLRLGNVYGPRQRPDLECGVVAKWMAALASGAESLGVTGDGEQTRAFVYVADAVTALLGAAGGPPIARANQTYAVVPAFRWSVNDLAARVWRACGRDGAVRVHRLPLPPGEVRLTLYTPNERDVDHIQLDEGLRRTWEWYRAQRAAT